MGTVAVLFRVYPDTGLEASVQKSIVDDMHPKSIGLEDVAFGIKVIKVLFIHDDKVGSSDFEDRLRKVKGVNEVEIIEETLIS